MARDQNDIREAVWKQRPYRFEFYDYTLHETGDLFYVVGRERGELDVGGRPMRVAIRTSRVFQRNGDGRWRQVHHHSSIDDPECWVVTRRLSSATWTVRRFRVAPDNYAACRTDSYLRLFRRVTMSEKRDFVLSTNEKIRTWNCPIERSAIALCRAVMPVSTAYYS